jgi:hypothetical protein
VHSGLGGVDPGNVHLMSSKILGDLTSLASTPLRELIYRNSKTSNVIRFIHSHPRPTNASRGLSDLPATLPEWNERAIMVPSASRAEPNAATCSDVNASRNLDDALSAQPLKYSLREIGGYWPCLLQYTVGFRSLVATDLVF